MSELSRADLEAIKRLLEQKASREAGLAQLEDYLQQHQDDAAGWYLMGRMFRSRNRHSLVALCMERTVSLDPQHIEARWDWYKAAGQMLDYELCQTLADQIRDLDPADPRGPLGMSVAAERLGEFDDAIVWAERCLDLDPDNGHAKSTLGFCYLHKRDYARGWDLYHHGLGYIEHRDKRTWVGEPEWDGTPGAHIAVYSEQGLGDQIAGIEPLRDFPGTVTALAVDAKLRNWFARCFPAVQYHGDDIPAAVANPAAPLRVDASINLFGLHKFLRRSEDAYPKTPFLTAHPRKAAMWRAALDQLGPAPKVGLAWTGGVRMTHSDERTHNVQDWLSALPFPVDYISLEYRKRDDETPEPIHVWPDAIRSPDYEDTAALISQLDAVVGPPTTVIHAAGALGVPAFCLVNEHPNPHYGTHGDRMPYYGSVRLIRTNIEDTCQALFESLLAMTPESIRRTA